MSKKINSQMYPFVNEGKLCPLLDNAEFLVEAYTSSGYRPAIKAFCKKVKWEEKPSVGISIGTEQLSTLLLSLFNSPSARAKLSSLQHKKSKLAAPPLHQAIWNWLLSSDPDMAGKFEKCCEERAGGLFFLSETGLAEVLNDYDSTTSSETLTTLARVVIAFAMLQPDDSAILTDTFLSKFPSMAGTLGVS
jgi:hypothetical protein